MQSEGAKCRLPMEEPIGNFCRTMVKFCNHLQSSCSALTESVDRRPIPLDSASTTFVQRVNRRVSAAGNDLNMLESMSFATVSFEELLGHCNEVLKKNQIDILALQDHLRSSSDYIPPLDFDEDDDGVEDFDLDNFSLGSDKLELDSSDSAAEDPLLDESLSLKKFGISDVSLATIASQDELNQNEDSRHSLRVSRDDYENLPKHVKGLVLWEDLLVVVEKMNSYIGTKKSKPDTFRQDEIELLGLGYKARSYLLVLIKMNQLSVETSEGVISYRVL